MKMLKKQLIKKLKNMNKLSQEKMYNFLLCAITLPFLLIYFSSVFIYINNWVNISRKNLVVSIFIIIILGVTFGVYNHLYLLIRSKYIKEKELLIDDVYPLFLIIILLISIIAMICSTIYIGLAHGYL
jgi:H+/Cl- antiporter ClcA